MPLLQAGHVQGKRGRWEQGRSQDHHSRSRWWPDWAAVWATGTARGGHRSHLCLQSWFMSEDLAIRQPCLILSSSPGEGPPLCFP